MKILIVDDSVFSQKINAQYIRMFLKDAEIAFANDGLEGLERYKELQPDYVFLDLLMPKLHGKELLNLIKQYDHNARIVVISADIQKNVREEISQYGILQFINKPFNEEKARTICELIRDDYDG
ncbi:response regulator [Desulfitobacterium chlororespirans]|uniref:Stage 0 sporulation protein A homolog n=1 Tax=Desulfitobacterium chlororespirans DSM 11544 TaxID=1121395 RepID=A0A1M7UPW2_9FIRM|nr:response regulator [Desulfitobacterium chlororespirans]SHN84964.1 Response regulator receiver domain-containing protein [Desulfitobacterium chlororespirans DSM 11544]